MRRPTNKAPSPMTNGNVRPGTNSTFYRTTPPATIRPRQGRSIGMV